MRIYIHSLSIIQELLPQKMIPLIKQHCRNFRKQLLKYRISISLAFNRDSYNCPKCGTWVTAENRKVENTLYLPLDDDQVVLFA